MRQHADIIITQAKVITFDVANPYAEAVAISGRRIGGVGSAEAIAAWRGPQTQVIDGQGCTLLPGFIDSHYHLLQGSIELGDVRLEQVSTMEQLTTAVWDFADNHPDQFWLVGRGLRYNFLTKNQPLTRHHLDAIIAARPLIVFAYDNHTAWANTLALRRANLLPGGQTGPNSEIVMGTDGLANGELREPGAYNLITAMIPPPNEARKRTLLQKGLREAAAVGLTSVHNMDGDKAQLALYATMAEAGELTLRVYCPYSVTPDMPPEVLSEATALRQAYQSNLVRSGCVKFFLDGVIETYTGLLLDDYADRPGQRGGANFSIDQFTRLAIEADQLGLQIFAHAVGDGAVRRALDSFETVQRHNGQRDSRHRIEHIELIHPADLPRLAQLGVIASMQPGHAPLATTGPDPWLARVGPTRWPWSFAWESLRQAGARLIFGSDWPVATQNPFQGLYGALNRQPWGPGQPDQRQTLLDALAAYTLEAAYAEFQEQRKGQLRAGLLADMVLLADDILTVPGENIAQLYPVLTICDGRIVYQS